MTPDLPELTDAQIIEARDNLLPSQGESFDCIAFARAIERLARSTAAQPVEPIIPDGWVPLRMEWEPGYPEDVAFGPQRMMDRLKKWLDKHFAAVTAAASGDSTPPSVPRPALPEQAGWAMEMHGVCVLFVNNAEKASGASPGAITRVFTEAQVLALLAVQGDSIGAPRPEPEVAGQGRWWRKKPVVIEAIRWDGTKDGVSAAEATFPALESVRMSCYINRPEVIRWEIRTLEGVLRVLPGDWIIRGIKGEHYPCKPDIFAATYEPAEPPQAASGSRRD